MLSDKWQLIIELVAVVSLGIALIMAILFDRTELSTNIASGLIGFIGGAAAVRKGGDDKWR